MEFLSSSQLYANQQIAGETRTEKWKEIGRIVKCIAKESDFSQAAAAKNVPKALVPLFKVLVGVKTKSHAFITEALKSNNSYVTVEALRAKWYFNGSEESFANYSFFSTEVLPFVSMSTRREIVKRLALGLADKKEELAEDFFNGFTSSYGVNEAVRLLPACRSEFVYDAIVKHKIVLSNKILKALYFKYPDVALRYLRFTNPYGKKDEIERTMYRLIQPHDYQSFMPCLIKKHPDVFVDLQEVSHSSDSLSLTRARMFLKTTKEIIIQRPKDIIDLMPFKLVYDSLTKEEFETMFGNLLEPRWEMFNMDDMINFLDYYPKEEKANLIKNKVKEKYGHDLYEKVEKLSCKYFLLVSKEERYELTKRILKSRHEIDITDEETSWWCYLPVEEAISALKIQIDKSWKTGKKQKLFSQLIYVCKLNEDKKALLEVLRYVDDNHKNEKIDVICNMLDRVVQEFNIDTFESEYWAVLFNIIKRIKLKKENARECWLLIKILKRHVHYCEKNNLPSDEIVEVIAHLFEEGRVFGSWKLLEDTAALERKYLDATFKRDYWLNMNLKKNVVDGIYAYNTRHNLANSDQRLSIKDYPHLLAEVEQIIKNQEERMKKNETEKIWIVCANNLLRKHEPELYSSWFPGVNFSDSDSESSETHRENHSEIHSENHSETHSENRSETHSENHSETHSENHSETHSENHSETHSENHSENQNDDVNEEDRSTPEVKEIKEVEEIKEDKEIKEVEEIKEDKEIKEVEEIKEDKEIKDDKEIKEVKEIKEKKIYITEAVIALKRNYKQIKDNWVRYYECCKNEMTTKKKHRVKIFLRALRWYQDVPIKFAELAIKEKNFSIIGHLFEGETFYKIAETYLPKEDEEDHNTSYLNALHITTAVKNTTTPIPTDLVEKYINAPYMYSFKNYINDGLKLWSHVAYRTSADKVIELSKNLAKERLFMKRHSIRLMDLTAARSDLVKFYSELWQNEKHPMIRQILAEKTGKLFAKRPSEDTWQLISTCIAGLTFTEGDTLEELLGSKPVPPEFASVYAEQVLKKVHEFTDKGMPKYDSAKYLLQLFENIKSDCKDRLPEEFYKNSLQYYLDSFYEFNNADRFIVKVFLNPNSVHFEERLKYMTQVLKEESKRWYNLSIKERKNFPNFVDSFVQAVVYEVQKFKGNLKLVESLYDIFSTTFTPHQHAWSHIMLFLSTEYMRAKQSFGEFGKQLSAKIDCLVEKYTPEYFMQIVDLIREFICNFSCFEYSTTVQNRLNFLDGLIEKKNIHGLIIAAKLLHQKTVTEYDSQHCRILEQLSEVDNPIVQSLL